MVAESRSLSVLPCVPRGLSFALAFAVLSLGVRIGRGIFAIGSCRFRMNRPDLGREERDNLGSRGAETEVPRWGGREWSNCTWACT